MRFKYALAAVLAVAVLCGCSRINYDNGGENAQNGTENGQNPQFNDNQSTPFPVNRRAYSDKKQMEELTEAEVLSDFPDFEGEGYIRLTEGQKADFRLNLPASQHYGIGLVMRTEEAVISLSTSGEELGAFYLKNADEFTEIRLEGLYLSAGVNHLTLTQLKGTAYIDFLLVNDFELPQARFQTSRLPANLSASNNVRLLMDYFGEIFGKKTLLAQHVTPGTNAELNALLEKTGRLPALRCSDLMAYSRSYRGEKPAVNDIELALEWAQKGGLLSYSWTWYSPVIGGSKSHYYAGLSDFRLNEAFTTVNVATMGEEEVAALYEAGTVSRSCLEIIREIDHMAENLKPLQEAKIPLLWRPLHQASTKWFWWGDCDTEAYKWLWRLMFERFSDFHGLDNLIWVWAGQDADYYPGDEFADIIGEDIYNTGETSNLPVFVRAGMYSSRRKLTAMTECGLLPSPDLLNRDSAFWLWTALYRGDYIIDSELNTKARLDRAYSHEVTITLDKLPEIFFS